MLSKNMQKAPTLVKVVQGTSKPNKTKPKKYQQRPKQARKQTEAQKGIKRQTKNKKYQKSLTKQKQSNDKT